MDKRISVELVLASTPCEEYTSDIILDLAAGRKEVTLDEVLALNLPIPDLLWLLLRQPWLSEKELFELANDFYLSVKDQGNSAVNQTLLASRGEFNKDHFLVYDANVLDRFSAMSEGTKRAMYAATWATKAALKSVRAVTGFAYDQVKEQFRLSQLNLVINKIKER